MLDDLAAAAGPALLDTHRDPDHNRTVFTLAGPADLVEESSRALARATVARLDLRHHAGAHPRLGVLDVVPFVPYEPGRAAPEDLTAAVEARDRFAHWLGAEVGVPSFLYGPLAGGRARTLPDIRRLAFAPGPGRTAPRRRAGAGRPAPRRHRGRGAAGSWSPTTSGSPRSRWPGRWRRSCAAPRCGRSAWPWGRGPRCRATSSSRTATGPPGSTTRWPPWCSERGAEVEGRRTGRARPRSGAGRRALRPAGGARPVGGRRRWSPGSQRLLIGL